MGCQASRSNAVADGVAKVTKADSPDGAPVGVSPADAIQPDQTPADSTAAADTSDTSAKPPAENGVPKNASADPSTTDLPASSRSSANGTVRKRQARKKQETTANGNNHMTLDEWFNYSFDLADVTSRAPPKQIPRTKVIIGPVPEIPPST